MEAPDNPIDIERHDPRLEDLQRRGWDLHEQLTNRLESGRARDLARRLSACSHCGGREVFVSDHASIELYVGNAGQNLPFTLTVCRACGDARMSVTDPGSLALATNAAGTRAFRLITVDAAGKSGPYR
jgi:hypothetical protein